MDIMSFLENIGKSIIHEYDPKNAYENAQINEQLLMNQAKKDRKNLKYAFRQHDAEKRGIHVDLCIGLESEPEVADFTLSQKVKGLEDLIQLDKRILAKPMFPHETRLYLIKPIGYSERIGEGYGKGIWKIIAKGNAIQKGDHRSFTLENSEFRLQLFHMDLFVWNLTKKS